MAKSSKDVGIYGRALFVCAVMDVVPENEILKQLMIEAWNDLKQTPVGVVFNTPPDEWGGDKRKGLGGNKITSYGRSCNT